MRILLLGVGLQGRAALYDLVHSPEVEQVVAADADLPRLRAYAERLDASKLACVGLDAENEAQLRALLANAEAAIVLLPNRYNLSLARLALEQGVHLVHSSYASPELLALGCAARRRGVAILPEFGFDPGIDLVLSGAAVRELDSVQVYNSYGAGFPEPTAAHNPLRYKVSWSLAGVLTAYQREARLVRGGQVVTVPGREIFAPHNVHVLSLRDWGPMEAYPNGDVVPFLERLGIETTVQEAGRYSARYPGHSAFWHTLSQLGFLSDQPMRVGEAQVAPREVVRALLEPQLQYADGERDVAFLRVEVAGLKGGQPQRIVYELTDLRDLEAGLLAMNRTVGFTASIGAQMILGGQIEKRGVLSPLTDVPLEPFLRALDSRGIRVVRSDEAG